MRRYTLAQGATWLAGMVCIVACSEVATIHYYGPGSEGATTRWENPLTQGSSRWSGPDNRVTLTAQGVALEVWSETWGQGTVWLLGPAFVPIVPVFPISWILWWMREGLEDKPLRIWMTLKESSGDVLVEPADWAIRAENGDRIVPLGTEPVVVSPGRWLGFEYSTRGRSFDQFTLEPRLRAADSTDVVLPSVTFRRGKGTVITFSP